LTAVLIKKNDRENGVKKKPPHDAEAFFGTSGDLKAAGFAMDS
jgi:hypothetical protein